jgi:exonuclease SbcC
MKILTLRFANLNSLYGQWFIDFTSREYEQDGLFAITGPTGSGKTTILDAICLSLYGRTPRLEAVNAQSNEIMSRGKGDCFAEVVCSSAKGNFRCHWSQRRAYGKAEGNLGDSQHEFADLDQPKVLYTKKREVAAAVEKYSGMNYNRFIRSMLLAQGDFAAFLASSASDRSPILEQITGTEIYSQISQHVHRITAEHTSAYKELKNREEILLPTSTTHIHKRKKLLLHWVEINQKRQRSFSRLQIQFGELKQKKEELALVEEQQQQLLGAQQSHQIKKEQFQWAQKALKVAPAYHTMVKSKEELTKSNALEKELKITARQAKEELSEKEKNKKVAEERQKAILTEEKQLRPLLTTVRLLDQKIAAKDQEADKQRALVVLLSTKRTQNTLALSAKEKEIEQHTLQSQNTALWLEQNKWIEQLQKELPKLRVVAQKVTEAASTILRCNQYAATQEKKKEALLTELAESEQKLKELKATLEEHRQKVTTIETKIQSLLENKLLREWEAEKKHLLEVQLLQTAIAGLDEHRQNLVDGSPCPLCGALSHPYVTSLPTAPTDTAIRLDKIETLLQTVNTLKEEQQEQQTTLNRLTGLLTSLETHDASLQQNLVGLNTDLEANQKELLLAEKQQEDQKTQMELLAPQIVSESAAEFLNEAETMVKRWEQEKGEAQQATYQLNLLVMEQKQLRQRVQEAQKELDQKRLERRMFVRDVNKQKEERKALFGNKDPDEQELMISKSVEEVKQQCEQALEHLSKAESQAQRAEQNWEFAQKRLSELTQSSLIADQEFDKQLQELGFATVEEFEEKLLDEPSLTHLGQEVEGYERSLEANGLAKKQLQKQLSLILSTLAHGWTDKKVAKEVELCDRNLIELHQNIGSLDRELAEATQKKEQLKQLKEQIALQQKRVESWELLNRLIGSFDGKKYRNFAQTLTFELLIAHANEQLRALSDRYVLTANPQEPLEFSVIDRYQGKEVRSARNLSGGESFLVSLALALGLSTIASQKMQVDSLFLDEGFGTLDEQTLETALAALSSLRSKGKLVGVISHVGALAERIPTQIAVIPSSGSKSILRGPGIDDKG